MNPISNSLFTRAYGKITGIRYNISYSQAGEDIIVNFWKTAKKIGDFTYFDIGANHPIVLNNTFKFYEQGYTGVCVEPDPHLCEQLKKRRKKDNIVNCGVSTGENTEGTLFVFSDNLLNTFSREEADELVKDHGARLVKELPVALIDINTLFERYYKPATATFLSMDIEGLDFSILSKLDFNRYRPAVICLETVDYTDDASSKKRKNILDLMDGKDYFIFADTYLNTIFVDRRRYS